MSVLHLEIPGLDYYVCVEFPNDQALKIGAVKAVALLKYDCKAKVSYYNKETGKSIDNSHSE